MKFLRILAPMFLFNTVWGGADVTLVKENVPLYEIATLTCQSTDYFQNPFEDVRFTARFTSPQGKIYQIEGFYNGVQIWQLRFMPGEQGTWQFSWNFGTYSGNGTFLCTPRQKPHLHGHLKIDPANKRKLIFDDGSPFHWIGGKYIDLTDPFGEPDQLPYSKPERLSPEIYIPLVHDYLENLSLMGLNGVVIKIRVLPLKYDLHSLDLQFMAHVDQILKWCMDYGIVAQINIFDTWGKRKQNVDWLIRTVQTHELLLEPWDPATYSNETEFYLRYLVARFSAYPIVLWELWNEAERLGVSAHYATEIYMPIIRSYDPYGLPVGASEIYAGSYPLDITFFHAGWKCQPSEWNWTHDITLDPTLYKKYRNYGHLGYSNGKPIIWNEMHPYEGQTLDEEYDWFRASFWGNITAGCAGTGEYGWSDIRAVPDKCTVYHKHLASFLTQVKDLNALQPNDIDIIVSQGRGMLCYNPGKEYIIYHYTQHNNSQSNLKVYLAKGDYICHFYDPKTGTLAGPSDFVTVHRSGWHSFTTPTFDQDIVFYILEKNFAQHTAVPVELAYFGTDLSMEGIVLNWQTSSESNNYGFEVQRSYNGSDFQKIGFVRGEGTTFDTHIYHYADRTAAHGWIHYRLKQIDFDGSFAYSPVEKVNFQPQAQSSYYAGAYPNPARCSTSIRFKIDQPAELKITIFNILKQVVYTKKISKSFIGSNLIRWDGVDDSNRPLPSGIYFYILESDIQTSGMPLHGKIVLMR